MLKENEKNLAIVMHLSVFAGALVPMAGIFAPIVIWLLKRKESPYLDRQGKEVLNLLIFDVFLVGTLFALYLFATLTADTNAINGFAPLVLGSIGLMLFMLIPCAVYGIVLPIVAAIRCSSGEEYRYPLLFRVIR